MHILFIPVSTPKGIGEYKRCEAIALALQHAQRQNQMQNDQQEAMLHLSFALNQSVRYLNDVPFKVYSLPKSATKCNDEVIALLHQQQPDLVVFDSTCRKPQLRAAKAVGAKVIFVSSRPKPRRKGLKPSRSDYIDWHVTVQPTPLRQPNAPEHETNRANYPQLHPVDVLLPPMAMAANLALLPAASPASSQLLSIGESKIEFADQSKPLLVVSPGGGGQHYKDVDAVDVFAEAAIRLARQAMVNVIVVLGPNATRSADTYLNYSREVVTDNCHFVQSLSQVDYLRLCQQADYLLINGGSTLSQALTMPAAMVVVATAKDQYERIDRLAKLGYLEPAQLQVASILSAVERAMHSQALLERPVLTNGMQDVVNKIMSYRNP